MSMQRVHIKLVTHGLVVPERDRVEQIQRLDGKTNAQIKQNVQMIVGQDQLVVNAYVKMIMWRMVLINLEDNSTITLSISGAELDSFIQNGRYPIMDDAGLENNERINIQFKGFLNGQEVVTENYTVASDCCHVFLVSGNTEIVL